MFEVDFISGNVITVKWNPSDTNADATGLMQFANGDIEAFETTNARQGVRATSSKTTGKWYIEFEILALTGGGADIYVGFCPVGTALNHNAADASNAIYWRGAGTIKDQTHGAATSFALNDVVQMAIDLDNAKAWLAKASNTWIGGGSPSAGTTETVLYTNSVGLALFPNYQSDNTTAVEQRVKILGHSFNQHNTAPSGFTPWGD